MWLPAEYVVISGICCRVTEQVTESSWWLSTVQSWPVPYDDKNFVKGFNVSTICQCREIRAPGCSERSWVLVRGQIQCFFSTAALFARLLLAFDRHTDRQITRGCRQCLEFLTPLLIWFTVTQERKPKSQSLKRTPPPYYRWLLISNMWIRQLLQQSFQSWSSCWGMGCVGEGVCLCISGFHCCLFICRNV